MSFQDRLDDVKDGARHLQLQGVAQKTYVSTGFRAVGFRFWAEGLGFYKVRGSHGSGFGVGAWRGVVGFHAMWGP